MFIVYVIQSVSTGKIYTGHTNCIERRIREHNFRNKRFTSNKGPWQLVYKEEYPDRSLAMTREKFLKSGKGREFLKQQINNNWQSSPPEADWL